MARKRKGEVKVNDVDIELEEEACDEKSEGVPVPGGPSPFLKKGYYVVRADGQIFANPKNGEPLRFSTKVQATTFAECIGNSGVFIPVGDVCWVG